MTRYLTARVAGVTFEGRQEKIARLSMGDPVQIVPEPDNPYDQNALAVHIAHDGEILHCGYIPREIAKKIAPLLEGEKVMASISEFTGGFAFDDGSNASLGLLITIELPQ